MKKQSLIVMTAALMISGCSTIMNGTTQKVLVTTHTGEAANCEIRDGKSTYQVQTPGYVVVNRGDGPLSINCKAAASSGVASIPESYDETSIWLGHGSLVVDSITGAYQKYPVQIIVPMSPVSMPPAAVSPATQIP